MTVTLLTLFCLSRSSAWQVDSLSSDSVHSAAEHHKVLRFTTRIHSSGFFNFSGRICAPTPAIDGLGLYESKKFGASIFSAKDLYDKHSDNNFTFAILYKRFKINNTFSVAPNAGVVMEGFAKSFGDRFFLISTVKLSKRLTVDETTLLSNLLSSEEKEWINRIRFVYSQTEHLQLILSNWHNNAVFDDNAYMSASLQAAYNRIEISHHTYLQTAVSFFVMARSNEEVPVNEKSSVIFTLSLTVE